MRILSEGVRGPVAGWSVAALLAACLPVPAASAEAYPSKPIRIIVPFGAGGIADFTARAVAQKMTASLGQPVVIENHPSAGGVITTQADARGEPSCYTLLLTSNGHPVRVAKIKL